MEKLYEIEGYFTYGDFRNFEKENSWKGKIVLKDDKRFEGIVIDSGDDTNRMISGYIVNYQLMILDKFNLKGYDPCAFTAFSNGESFEGFYSSITIFGETVAGNCKIELASTEQKEEEINKITEEVEEFKDKMDRFSSHIYSQILEYGDSNYPLMEQNIEAMKEEGNGIINGVKVKKITLPKLGQ